MEFYRDILGLGGSTGGGAGRSGVVRVVVVQYSQDLRGGNERHLWMAWQNNQATKISHLRAQITWDIVAQGSEAHH